MNKKQKAACRKLSEETLRKLNRLDDRHTKEGFKLGYQAALESEGVKTKKLVEALKNIKSITLDDLDRNGCSYWIEKSVCEANRALAEFEGGRDE